MRNGTVAMESLEFFATRTIHILQRAHQHHQWAVLLEEFHASSVIYVVRSKSTCHTFYFAERARNDELSYGRPLLACSRVYAVKSAGIFFFFCHTLRWK